MRASPPLCPDVPAPDGRAALTAARRVVVKIGSRVLVQRSGRPNLPRMRALVGDIAAARRAGREMTVVTSGAVGAGMEALGLRARPKRLPELQMCAAVGQTRLMTRYDRLFAARGCGVGQVLLTHDGLKMRERHLNARNTLMHLLRRGMVPIINENDTVAVEEIKFGDNDLLAALVSLLLDADLLILLTTVDGLRAPLPGGKRTRRIPRLREVTARELALAIGKGSELSTGGMASKLQSAQMAVKAGIPVVIADGRNPRVVRDVLAGADVGTLIGGADAGAGRALSGRQRWIAFFHKPQGDLALDAGAVSAVENQGRSLLPIGIRAVTGKFKTGAVVNLRGPDGRLVGRGMVSYGADELRRIMGRRSSEMAALLGGAADFEEAVHRDNLVLIGSPAD